MEDYPKLRPIEVFPTEHGGDRAICLRDPTHVSESVLLLPIPLFEIVRLFDGTHSIRDIQADYMRRHQEILFEEKVREIISKLDEHLFLESERFRERRAAVESEYLASPSRPAFLAGKSYPEDSEALAAVLDGHFTTDGGPGMPDRDRNRGPIRGLVAPHIDFDRGGSTYAWAHHALAESEAPDLFIIFGTAHASPRNLFIVGRKDYDTPFGPAPVDGPFIAKLEKELGSGFYEDEIAHRTEHSIEFQAIYLRHLYGERHPFTIVPILCSSFQEFLIDGATPSSSERCSRFFRAIRALAEAEERRVCIIASVDLAHVGPQFGDQEPVDAGMLRVLEERDREMLEPALRADAEGFFRYVHGENDRRRICGLSPIYAMLSILAPADGELLRYAQWHDPIGTVTFASLCYR